MRAVMAPWITIALIATGVIVRFTTLDYHSLWLDEAFSVMTVKDVPAATIWSPGIDPIHPPLFYAILKSSLTLFGVAETSARLPSAVASVINLLVIWLLGRRLFPGRDVGPIAALLLAVAPIDLWYAQEARMYELVTMAGLIFALGLVTDKWWSMILIALGLAGGLYLDHTMWPLAIGIASAGAVHWFHGSRSMVMALRSVAGIVIGLVVSAPLWAQANVAFGQLDKVSLFRGLNRVLGVPTVTAIPLPLTMLLFAAVVLAGTVACFWLLSRADQFGWLRPAIVAAFAFVTVCAVVPRAYSLKQVIVCVWPFGVLLAAWAIGSQNNRRGLAAVAAVSVCACAVTFATPRADWRRVAAHVATHAPAGTSIVFDPPYDALPYQFYARRNEPPERPRDAGELRDALSSPAGVCIVAERFGARPPTSPSEAWLDAHRPLTDATRFSRLELRCYR